MTWSRCNRRSCVAVVAAAMSLACAGSGAANVFVGGREWRQLTETVNFTWNEVNSVCGSGFCAGGTGPLATLNGWYWADNAHVRLLFEELIIPGSVQFPTACAQFYPGTDVPDIEAAIGASGFAPTIVRHVYGLSRTPCPDFEQSAYEPHLQDEANNDRAGLCGLATPNDMRRDSVGVWLYRPIEPTTLFDRGVDSLGNHLIYDSELNVTWYQPNNEEQDWFQARDYAANLTVSYQGRIVDDWRLPRATDTGTGILSPGCFAGWGDEPGNENCHGELAHLYVLLGGRAYANGIGINPRPYGEGNPFHTWPACSDPGCLGGGYYWLDEEGPWGQGPTGYLIRWNNDYWGTTGATGPVHAYQTDYKFAWAVRDGDVAAGTPIAVVLPDMNSDGVGDVALVRAGPIRAEIRSGQSGALLRIVGFLDDSMTPLSAQPLPDTDGNGVPEIAVLAVRRSDGRGVIEIRNVTGDPMTRNMWFADVYRPLTMKVIEDDADGNGVPELAVLFTRYSDGRGLIQIQNAYEGTTTWLIWPAAGLNSKDIEVLPDADGNGQPELAVLSTRDSDGRIVVEVGNAISWMSAHTIWFMSGNTPIDLAAVPDKDGNGLPEVAVLSRRNSDGRIVVEVKNALGSTNPSAVWFAAGHTAIAVHPVADSDGNAVPELAVLSTRDVDGRVLVEVKNAAGATNPRALWYTAGYTARDLSILNDFDGNGIDEAAVLMIRNSDGRMMMQRRNAVGPPVPKDYWFSP